MKKQTSLKIIVWISIAGILFSGYLSYFELFVKVCPLGSGCQNLFGLPVCVYGLIMYLLVFVIAIFGLRSKK
ncbi:MAG: hypothetical protein Q8N99_05730 [Nanoarchaeota archaeon]|nr:hypothetical protein [Nanoarchaeota archaeon]